MEAMGTDDPVIMLTVCVLTSVVTALSIDQQWFPQACTQLEYLIGVLDKHTDQVFLFSRFQYSHVPSNNLPNSSSNSNRQATQPKLVYTRYILLVQLFIISGVLWYRKDITDTYPEGTSWVRVCDKVLDVSVGPSDQVDSSLKVIA